MIHETIYSLDLDDEPEVPERHVSLLDAKTLVSTPTETIALSNAYSLQLSRLISNIIQRYTPTESTVDCSLYDFHITYPRDEALHKNIWVTLPGVSSVVVVVVAVFLSS